MRSLRAWCWRVASLVRRRQLEREADEELQSHLAMHIEDNIRAGMTAGEARRVALMKLGGLDQTRERVRDRRGIPAFETIVKDVQFAARLMRRAPGFTTVVLATLAVGIGANTVMFSVVNTVLLRPLPYSDPDRLVLVRPVEGVNRTPGFAAAPDFYRYRAENRSFEQLDAFYTRASNLTGGSEPERAATLIVSSGFFATLGVQPAHGRGFVRQDEEWGSHRTVILSDGLWQRRFGSDPTIVGQAIAINGEPYGVVGILPPAFSFLNADAQLFLPLAFERGDNMNSRSNYFLRMVGRLGPTVTAEQATADLDGITNAIGAEHQVAAAMATSVTSLQDALVGNVRRPVVVLLGAVAFVLLIACANLANLMLARAVSRQREIGVRFAMGASRRRLIRQFVLESLLLSLTGGALALALAYALASTLNLISPQVLPRAEDIRVDPTVLLFTFAISTVAGVLLGLVPLASAGRNQLAATLKDSGRTSSDSRARLGLRSTMIVAEVALSLVLLAGAGLTMKSMYQLLHVDMGFRTDHVLTMQINLPPRKYVDLELARQFNPAAYVRATGFFNDVIGRVRAVRGVEAVGAINGLPLMGEVWSKYVTLFDRPLPADLSGLSSIQYRVIAGDYFQALGIRLVSGRAFSDHDTQTAPKVAIVNRAMVRRDWNGQDPIGKIISVNPPLELLPRPMVEEARRTGTLPANYSPDKYTIVGVADDARYGGLATAAVPLVYVPYSQGAEGATDMFVVVRTSTDPLALTGAIREQIAQVDGDQPIASIRTMEARMSSSVARPRLQTNVLAAFAAIAVLLAGVGIYGVMSYGVNERAKEIGIRLALGAARREVVAMILRQGARLTAIGIAIGVAAALSLAQVLRTLLFDVSTTDPMVFATIVMVMAATSCVAVWLPARRAARLDPMATLRSE